MRLYLAIIAGLAASTPAYAQSLHLTHGDRAVEISAGWSVGPSSNGLELTAGFSLDGRTDAGITVARYKYTFEDGFESKFSEYAPFVRVFLVKEQNGAPVSLSLNGQVFVDDYAADEDSGKYVQIGTTVYKQLKLSDRFALIPYAGFAFVAESYSFGGAPADRAQYLTRDFGLHFTTDATRVWFVRATLAEQSFRRETYRGARIAVLRRF
jgi:hypothetical protein